MAITTNFDHLMEDAVNYYIQNIPLVIGHESLSHYITKSLKRPTIVKIHRDLLFNPANTVQDVELLHDNWKKALDVIFSEYHPVFIGYAGNDNSLMNYLIENGPRFKRGELNCPYWMLYETDRLEGKVLEFLDCSDGYCVHHPGFDEVLYLLGAEFGYKMPLKEKFLEDAERRYQMLSDAIDSFTDKQKKEGTSVSGDGEGGEESDIDEAVRQITDQTEHQKIYREAVKLNNSGQYEKAVELKRKLVEMQPGNARYWNSFGISLHELGRYEEAILEEETAVKLEPDNKKYNENLGLFRIAALR